MVKIAKYFATAIAIAAVVAGSSAASAQQSNPSDRALNNMSRKGNPTLSRMSLGTVCPTIKTVKGAEFLWKSEISKHISSKDPRASGPSFICGKICASKFPMDFFFSDGTKAGRVGYYGTYHGNGKARAYCAVGGAPACSIADIAKQSTQSGRDGYLYLQLSRTTCYKVRPLGRTGRV